MWCAKIIKKLRQFEPPRKYHRKTPTPPPESIEPSPFYVPTQEYLGHHEQPPSGLFQPLEAVEMKEGQLPKISEEEIKLHPSLTIGSQDDSGPHLCPCVSC